MASSRKLGSFNNRLQQLVRRDQQLLQQRCLSAKSDDNVWKKFPDGSRFWKPLDKDDDKKHKGQNNGQQNPGGQYQRPIFVAATRQHVGKTTTSLALISGLKKHYKKVGFLKPVGQQHVEVKSENRGAMIRVDKDVCLVREHFHLDHIDYEDMSPVIIPAGYTKKYVDGEISFQQQLQDVIHSMEQITNASDVVLCEGTGHCAVGSIVGLNNAKVASMIGADMVLVANGGLGSAFDELELNRILCQHYNVRIAGVIINKVIPEKLEQTKHYMRKAMMDAWGIPLLGCIPDRPFLGCPALADLENLFQTKLISGQEHKFRHYSIQDINVVTTSLTRFLENLRQKPSRTLYICHVTRDDLIVGFMGEYQRRREKSEKPFEAALMVCGRRGKYQISDEVMDMLKGLKGAPVMIVDYATHDTMSMIHQYTPKLNIHDTNRVAVAVDHYEPHIDFEELMRRTRANNSSFNEPGSISMDDLKRI
jgi:BioD-like phosphotransacetylase family protein